MKTTVKNLLERAKARTAAPAASGAATPAPTQTKSLPRRGPAVREVFNSDGPHVTTGELGDRGYSAQKALATAMGHCRPDNAKLEMHVSDLLDALYEKRWIERDPRGVMMPLGLELMPDEIQSQPKYQEIKNLVLAGAKAPDADETAWLRKRFSYGSKAQSWIDTFTGGAVVGAPVQGELIDLLRNKLAFGNASISAMPPTGVRFPRWLKDPLGSWANENEQVDPTQAKTGTTTFLPKKLLCLADFPNELIAYGSPSVDAMFRTSLMASVALSMDAGFLRGNGGDDQPWGILTMADEQANGVKDWGINLIEIGADQVLNTAPQDLMNFPSAVESNNGEMTQWIGRPDYFWDILKQRWSTSAGAGQGGFLYDFARAAKDGFPAQLIGVPYNKTNQIQKFVGDNPTEYAFQTDLIGLDISDFWVGLLGAVEVVSSTEAGESFKRDQTILRAKLVGNGGPKHPGLVAVARGLQYN